MTKYVFLDTETTGLELHKINHRIILLASIEYKDSAPTGNVFKLKIDPEGKKSNKDAIRVHGILDEELVGLPTFKDIHEEFINFIKDSQPILVSGYFTKIQI